MQWIRWPDTPENGMRAHMRGRVGYVMSKGKCCVRCVVAQHRIKYERDAENNRRV